MCLFLRFAASTLTEWRRQRNLKDLFVDNRDTFKLFVIARYMFSLGFFVPVLTVASQFLEFRGTLNVVIDIILVS